MTIRHLNVFITVCKYNSITKAAQELMIAQPAVSATIKELEKYYNITLFERINKRLVLTDIGKELLIKAKDVITSFTIFEKTAGKFTQVLCLKIGSSLTIGRTLLPKILSKISYEYPQVKYEVIINQTSELEKMVSAGLIDFALVEGKTNTKNIISSQFGNDKLVVACGKNYSIENNIDITELLKHPLFLREKGSASRDYIDSLLTIYNMSINPIIESVSNEALIALVSNNLGITILPESIVLDSLMDKLKIITINDISLERQYSLIYHKDKILSSIQTKVMKLCLCTNKN